MTERIKDTYQKKLCFFISINIIVFWVISLNGLFKPEIFHLIADELSNPKSIFVIISPIVAIVLNGLFSNKLKEIIVFWRLKNRLPGCRAFTELILNDQRIDIEKLERKIGKFPKDPTEQNRKWYGLYRNKNDNDIVIGSHRDFLFTRDLCAASFLFMLIFTPIAFIYWEDKGIRNIYIGYLLLQYIVTSIAAKNYGNRFACNVLAVVSQE
ncbi:MAG: hypothetical protein PHT06_04470 [Dehalococcoidales bacterium]|nr:hypothetical protein [Dehalococcoidales bacterium]